MPRRSVVMPEVFIAANFNLGHEHAARPPKVATRHHIPTVLDRDMSTSGEPLAPPRPTPNAEWRAYGWRIGSNDLLGESGSKAAPTLISNCFLAECDSKNAHAIAFRTAAIIMVEVLLEGSAKSHAPTA